MKILKFTSPPSKKQIAIFCFENDSLSQTITDYTVLPQQTRKKIAKPETILDEKLRFHVIGCGVHNSILHYILIDNFNEHHIVTWNEFWKLENCYQDDIVVFFEKTTV